MRYMPVNSGSVLHGIWHDLRLRELKDKLEEMHVMYELSHKKGASMSNKKFVSFQDLTLSRNELGLVVVSGLPTGDSTLIVVPPIGSVQTDKIGFNDLSIDERCALWALIYGQSYNERPTFKPVSVPNHGGIPVKSPKSDKVLIKFLHDSVPVVSPQLAELLSLAGMSLDDLSAKSNTPTEYSFEFLSPYDEEQVASSLRLVEALSLAASTALHAIDKDFSCQVPKNVEITFKITGKK